MVEDTKDNNQTTNKGVSVHSESLPVGVHSYSEEETSSVSDFNRSFTDIRNEIQNVLDLMGPTSPAISTVQNTSSEADNEQSCISVNEPPKTPVARKNRSRSTSITESLKMTSSSLEKSKTDYTTTTSKSSQTRKDSSQMADIGSYSSINNFENLEDFEHSCCDHTHVCVSPPECMCVMGYPNSVPVAPSRICEGFQGYYPTPKSTRVTVECKKTGVFEWIKQRSFDMLIKKPSTNPCDLYKLNICGQECDGGLPKRVIFDLVEGLPRRSSSTVATNTIRNPVEKYKIKQSKSGSNINSRLPSKTNCNCKDVKNMTNEAITHPDKTQKNIYFDSDGNTRVDYYYFDHGNAHYFHTTDTPPVMKCEVLAEKTERYTTKFWAEFFASIHIGVSFCISFLLQLFKFLLYSIIRPLGVGFMQTASDYCFKPFLTTCFNGLIQPFLIFLYNIATSMRDLCDPIAEAFGYFCREVAVLFRAIRLCTYNKEEGVECGCDKKYKCEC